MNPTLQHFYNLPDPMIWAVKGVKTLEDITSYGDLLTFPQLKTRHDLENTYFFRYLQLRCAYQSQFRDRKVESLTLTLESMLSEDILEKPLSKSYKEFFKTTPKAVAKSRSRWEAEVSELQGEDWNEVWNRFSIWYQPETG